MPSILLQNINIISPKSPWHLKTANILIKEGEIHEIAASIAPENIDFVKEYKKQIEILMPIAKIFLFIEKYAKPIKNYNTLCEFKNLAEKVSTTFEVDMTGRYKKFIESYEEEVKLLNFNLSRLTDLSMEYLYTDKSLSYITGIDGLAFNLDSKVEVEDIAKKYSEELNS